MKRKMILKLVSFCAVFLLLFVAVSGVIKPKWLARDSMWEPATLIEEGFYAEPENSLDVICIGSSHVFLDISPMAMWKAEGITAYDLTSSIQRMWVSYYYLKEALKYQTPKVVVLDALAVHMDEYNDEDRNRKAHDYMKLSPEKIESVKNSIDPEGEESLTSYLFPVMRYHDRWKELSESDFTFFSKEKNYFAKGYDLNFQSVPYTGPADYMQPSEEVVSFGEKSGQFLQKIVDLCKEKNIALQLVKTPYAYWNTAQSNGVKAFADKNSVDFLDLNLHLSEMGVDWAVDSSDGGGHMNIAGAEKVSRFLGKYLKDRYALPDRRGDSAYRQWSLEEQVYDAEKAAGMLSREADPSVYLPQLKNKDYLVFVSAKGAAASAAGENGKALSSLGMSRKLKDGNNYAAVLYNGRPLYEDRSENPVDYFSEDCGGQKVHLKSQPDASGGSSVRINGKEYSKNADGINIVVYSMRLERVIDTANLNGLASPQMLR